jgi:hypothetical protein
LNQITVDEVLRTAKKKLKGRRVVAGEKPPQGVLV